MTRWALVKRFKGVWDIAKDKNGAWALFEDCEKAAVSQRALIEQQAQEIERVTERAKSYHDLAENQKNDSDNQAKEIAGLRELADLFLDRMATFGNWEDGCFYYNRISASELQILIDMARQALKEEHP